MTIEKDIKDEEMKAIEELRLRFEEDGESEILEDHHYLKRFLKARNFNLDNAEIMLRKHFEWRKKYDVKNSLKWKLPEVFEKYCPFIVIGHDKEGCLIRYTPSGSIDFSGILSSLKSEEVAKTIIYQLEYESAELKKESKRREKNVDKVIYITDFANLTFAQVTDKKVIYNFIFALQLFMNNYPERLKAAYALNVSIYFNFFYSLMKTVLPTTIMEKIHLYSDDSYKEDLLQLIDADELPAFLGGNRTDPDGNPLCKTFINHGGQKVPDSYFIRKNKTPLSKTPGVKKVTLSRAAFHEIKLDVKEPGSYLEWEFETKCRDIGFGVFFEELIDGEEKVSELVPMQRIDTEEYPETGTFRCENAGTYVILFDNTYSWIRAKEIFYRAKIVSPKEQEAQMKGS